MLQDLNLPLKKKAEGKMISVNCVFIDSYHHHGDVL